MQYPKQSIELQNLLKEDQDEWKEFAKIEFESGYKKQPKIEKLRKELRQRVQERASKMLIILDKIKEPSIHNIGQESALAMSVLATHTSLKTTKKVLKAFNDLYKLKPNDTRYQSIPAMTDWVAFLEHRPETFGTIWIFDNNSYPFLPTVKDFNDVNIRRERYGIEPLHWPKSLAIPLSKQPWLKKPLTQLVMREPTDEEYHSNADPYLD